MNDVLISLITWGGFPVVMGCLLSASLYTLRIAKWLSGEKAETFSDLFTPASRPSGKGLRGADAYQMTKKQVFTPGSEMDPELRRYFVLERRLRRIALVVFLVVAVTSWSQAWREEAALSEHQAAGQE